MEKENELLTEQLAQSKARIRKLEDDFEIALNWTRGYCEFMDKVIAGNIRDIEEIQKMRDKVGAFIKRHRLVLDEE